MNGLTRWIRKENGRRNREATSSRKNPKDKGKKDPNEESKILLGSVSETAADHSRQCVKKNNESFSDEYAAIESLKGCKAGDMFDAKSTLTGLKFQYDENPHSFEAPHASYANCKLWPAVQLHSYESAANVESTRVVDTTKIIRANSDFVLDKKAILAAIDEVLSI